MKITDADGQGDPNFVYVQVWSASAEHARYADVYAGVIDGRLDTVAKVVSAKKFVSREIFGAKLNVNLETQTLSVLTTKGVRVTDSFSCRTTPMKPMMFGGLGG